jgi:hypothetical protein
MSKIADKIRRATRIESAPIGFAAIATARKEPTLLLAVQLPFERRDKTEESLTQGADTVILGPINAIAPTDAFAAWAKGSDKAALGIWLGDASDEDVTKAKDAGIDYAVISLESSGITALHDELSYMLIAQEDMTDSTLRMLEGSPVEAMIVDAGRGPSTLKRHLDLKRLASFSRLPIFLRIEAEPSAKALEAYREVGVIALLIDGNQKDASSLLGSLRKSVDALPPRKRRRDDGFEARLPSIDRGRPAQREHEEEEEEEDD